jgi:hypothetical protein
LKCTERKKMRFNKKEKTKLGTKQKVTRFLWSPLTLSLGPQPHAMIETRFLEKTSWIEEYTGRVWKKMFWAEEWEQEFGHLIAFEI